MIDHKDQQARGGSWRQRMFACSLARAERMQHRVYGARKRTLLGDLQGDVLEIGPGNGVNLPYYRADIRWIGVEPNRHMHPYLQRAAAERGLPIELHNGTAEQLSMADTTIDAVVSTLVLCSVGDPALALAEIRRVLRPGGRLVVIEHVAAPRGTWLRRVQRLVRPLWSALADGCQPDRETGALIERAGFERLRIERFRVPMAVIGPHIAGVAYKPGGEQQHSPPR